MKLLLNDKEIIQFLEYLTRQLITPVEKQKLNEIVYEENELNEVIYHVLEKKQAGKLNKFKDKIPGKIERAVRNDLNLYLDKVKTILEESKNKRLLIIRKKFKLLINKFGEKEIFELYRKTPNAHGFIKSIGLQIDSAAEFKVRSEYSNSQEDCLMRNTIGNEKILVDKIDNNFPFWFIDSGYTNFLEGKHKVWHRLTRNHIHHTKDFVPSTDRLGIFKEFPKQWRSDGEYILVIEPGPFSASIFHVDIATWKYKIEKEIRQYTDKPIRFRPKINKKVRKPLYEELLNEDYYCVININSNAATESVWAGVPVITLDKHITNSVSRNSISDINNLYRPHLANWLCMLSYSQFTYEELVNGTAYNIIKKYHV